MKRVLSLLALFGLAAFSGCGEIEEATEEAIEETRVDATAEYQQELEEGLKKSYEGLGEGGEGGEGEAGGEGAEGEGQGKAEAYTDEFTEPPKADSTQENPDY